MKTRKTAGSKSTAAKKQQTKAATASGLKPADIKSIKCPMVKLYKNKKERMKIFLERLDFLYPDPACELIHRDPYELISATILSAQCTDKQVNKVTPALFAAYPMVQDMARANVKDVEELIHSTGFYKNKAKNLIGMAITVTEKHDGQIPDTMDELVKLPGVGRKTANVVLGNTYGVPGMVVDTHVMRISNKLDFVNSDNPEKIEKELEKQVPKAKWVDYSHQVILLGRALCTAKKTFCDQCPMSYIMEIRDIDPNSQE